jgi:hypothetical protein
MIDNAIFLKLQADLTALGSQMWDHVQVEGVDYGTCVFVRVILKPTATVIIIKQICNLIKLLCHQNVAYQEDGYSWQGSLTLDGQIVAGISGGWIGREDDQEAEFYTDDLKKW